MKITILFFCLHLIIMSHKSYGIEPHAVAPVHDKLHLESIDTTVDEDNKKTTSNHNLFQNEDSFVREIDFFGFIKTGVLVSSGATDSIGRPNAVAPTAAGNPILDKYPDKWRSTFQTQQSRFGFSILAKEDITGLVEFDFMDFSKSTPTVASQIRLRRAYINLENGPWSFRIGQDWDLFSPLGPHSYNYIGHYFGSGDLGFMRQQLQIYKKKNQWEHAIAIGYPTNNNQMMISNSELALVPTLALRETYKFNKANSLGFSAIVGHLKNHDTTETLSPFGLNAFFKKISSSLEISSEIYYGHNLENLSTVALGFSSTFETLKEWGGFLTFRYTKSIHGVFGGVGYSRILNPEKIQAVYSYESGNVIHTLARGYGIVENGTLRFGYDYSWTEKLKLFMELTYFKTKHKLDPVDVGTVKETQNVFYTEIGAKLEF